MIIELVYKKRLDGEMRNVGSIDMNIISKRGKIGSLIFLIPFSRQVVNELAVGDKAQIVMVVVFVEATGFGEVDGGDFYFAMDDRMQKASHRSPRRNSSQFEFLKSFLSYQHLC